MASIWDSAKQTYNDVANSKFVQDLKKNQNEYKGARGSATAFDSQYQVKQHMYPNDLMDPVGTYGGNYVIFYININVDSKLAQSGDQSLFMPDVPNRDRGDLIAQGLSKETLFVGNAALNAGGAVLGKLVGAGGAGATAAGLATVGAGANALMAASATRQQKRLKTAIALHVPNQLNIRYGMKWEEGDTAAMAMVTSAGQEVARALEKGDAKNLSQPAAAIITNLSLSKGPNAAAMSAATGLAANPKMEQVFKGVDFRTFSFEYQFFPRSAAEAENVMNIIYEFKYHMHPEFKDNNNFIYIYPSEFDVAYYTGGKENLNLHRHPSCVLTELSVNYTPNGTFTTFDNGMPTQINVQMQFRELALLTKDKIKDGL